MRFLKSIAILAVLATACASQPQHPSGRKFGAATTQVISASYNPSVSGLPGSVGDIVSVAGGASAWVKFGTGVTDWRAFPGESGGGLSTVVVDDTLTGDGSAESPLGINTESLPVMSDVIAIASGNQQDLTLSGLNGNADGDYLITGDIIYKGGSGSTSFTLRPFGTDETNLKSLIDYNNGSGVFSADTSGSPRANWFIGLENAVADTHIIFHVYISSKTGRIRQYWGRSNSVKASALVVNLKVTGWTTDIVTNITELTVHATVAGAIGSGSYIEARKLKRGIVAP